MGKTLNLAIVLTALLASIGMVAAIGPIYNSSTNNGGNIASSNPYAVNVSYNPTVGNYLVTSNGYTLYMYTPDKPYSGNSTCYGGCEKVWPVYYNANMYYPPSLPSYNFGVINRTDGTKQLTYKGYPLYTYVYDTAPGQINGQGVGGTWYVMSPNGPDTPGSSNGSSSTSTITNSSSPSGGGTNTTAVGIAGNVQRAANSTSGSSSSSAPSSSSNSSTTSTTSTTGSGSYSSTSGSSNWPIYLGAVVVVLVIIGLGYFLMRKR